MKPPFRFTKEDMPQLIKYFEQQINACKEEKIKLNHVLQCLDDTEIRARRVLNELKTFLKEGESK